MTHTHEVGLTVSAPQTQEEKAGCGAGGGLRGGLSGERDYGRIPNSGEVAGQVTKQAHAYNHCPPLLASRLDKNAVRRIVSPAHLLFSNEVVHELTIGDMSRKTGATAAQLQPVMQMIRQVSQVPNVSQVLPLHTNR